MARNAQLTYGVDMSQEDAAIALRQFAIAYPQFAVWQMQRRRQATSTGQVQTRLGLVRDFNTVPGSYIKGESVNIPIQGSAAEVLLASMAHLKQPVYHNVHDEILLSVPVDEADQAASELEEVMINGFISVFPE